MLFKTYNSKSKEQESQIVPLNDIPSNVREVLPSKYQFACYSDMPSGVIGISTNSIIHLVQNRSDKSLWAAKFNKNGRGIDEDDNVDDYRIFKKLFNNPVDIYLYDDVCLKTYIRGHEIAYYMINLDFFTHKDAHKMQSVYKNFHENIWKSKIYVNDENPTNVILSTDLNNIGIIDSRGYHKCSNKIEACRKGLNELYRWIGVDWLQCTNEPAVQNLLHNHRLMVYIKYLTLTFLIPGKKN